MEHKDKLKSIAELNKNIAIAQADPTNDEIKEKIVARFDKYTSSLAFKYTRSQFMLDHKDVKQIAILALIKCIPRIDLDRRTIDRVTGEERQASAAPFIKLYIEGAIKNHLRDHGYAIKISRDVFWNEAAPKPLMLNIDSNINIHNTESFSRPLTEVIPTTREDTLPETSYFKLNFMDIIKEKLDLLDKRYWSIIEGTLIRDKTQREMAKELDISQMHVSRLKIQALKFLRIDFDMIEWTTN